MLHKITERVGNGIITELVGNYNCLQTARWMSSDYLSL